MSTKLRARSETTGGAFSGNWIVMAVPAVLIIAALAWAWWRVPAAPATNPPGTTVETAALADGEHFGFITGVVGGAFMFDAAEMVTGDEAIGGALPGDEVGDGEVLPTDFSIRNPSDAVVALSLSDTASITVIGFDDSGAIEDMTIDPAGFAALFGGTYDGPAVYGAPVDLFPVTITVVGGETTTIKQFYLP